MQSSAATIIAICLGGIICCSACKPSSSSPSPAGYSGSLIASRTSGEAFHIYYIDSAFDAFAQFTATPGSGIPAFVDSVTVNGLPMELDGDSLGYMAPNFQNTLNFTSGANWFVKGANGISSFTYNDGRPYPSYNAIPDTISKANGYTFQINSTVAPATDSLVIEIDTGGAMGAYSKVGVGGGLTLTPAEINAMHSDSTVIVLYAMSHFDQTFGGQLFAFLKVRTYYKTVYLK